MKTFEIDRDNSVIADIEIVSGIIFNKALTTILNT